jgi:HTH-type transcriptional regulator, sugar sensing transcriptional regulator
MMEAIVARLREVGFTLYEARLYATLLRHGPQNGNELSRNSGVPSSKVYGTVEKLMAEGTVQSIKSEAGTQFVALQPVELINRLRRQFNDPLDFLAEKLPPLSSYVPDEVFLSVTGQSGVIEAAREIIGNATDELNLSLWESELDDLRASLDDAADRDVKTFGMLYSASADLPRGTWSRHTYEEIVGQRVGGRMLSLVADGDEAMIGRFPDRGTAAGVRTRNPVLTLIVSEYLHHDTVLQRAQINIGFDEWDRWWQADPELRGAIFGRALEKHRVDETPSKARTSAKTSSTSRAGANKRASSGAAGKR